MTDVTFSADGLLTLIILSLYTHCWDMCFVGYQQIEPHNCSLPAVCQVEHVFQNTVAYTVCSTEASTSSTLEASSLL